MENSCLNCGIWCGFASVCSDKCSQEFSEYLRIEVERDLARERELVGEIDYVRPSDGDRGRLMQTAVEIGENLNMMMTTAHKATRRDNRARINRFLQKILDARNPRKVNWTIHFSNGVTTDVSTSNRCSYRRMQHRILVSCSVMLPNLTPRAWEGQVGELLAEFRNTQAPFAESGTSPTCRREEAR